ncbi:MAG: hypothetical protein EVJ48_09375 [Candidatus Acidulodesulfobacterium acidiphilum]|uniref:Periplasmic heavy metal sensor n=1 Tax=Candidatus Acidulodesulfobacterium acidiphilum TaxID=2597224 RepID=A0A520X7N5_9DELT|nr:MAG: hypothetical protein EVJ48_09375 [Candidatus Acidulodesulfobacterium acidiphilum]
MRYKTMVVLIFIAIVFTIGIYAIPPSHASTLSAKKSAAKIAMIRKYFLSHSFDFGPIFYKYHPGPNWYLQHAKSLRLNSSQLVIIKKLDAGMIKDTVMGIKNLKLAYSKYKKDSMEVVPKIKTIINDIKNIGKAQTYLAYEMIPYHLKSYAILTPSQKKIFQGLRMAKLNAGCLAK